MVDVTDATFEAEILEKSDHTPVVVDLWAEWCGPCRTLGPIIEKVIDETDGEVLLAKVDVDANPELAKAFQVQGIPAVFAIHERKVVATFVGAQPEAMVRKFVEDLRPSEEKRQVSALLAKGDEASILEALEILPAEEPIILALAEFYVTEGRHDDALLQLDKIPESPESKRVAALARTGIGSLDVDATDDEGPLAGVEAKLDALLPQVKEDEAARQEYLDLLELLGPMDPRTTAYRRELTQKLF